MCAGFMQAPLQSLPHLSAIITSLPPFFTPVASDLASSPSSRPSFPSFPLFSVSLAWSMPLCSAISTAPASDQPRSDPSESSRNHSRLLNIHYWQLEICTVRIRMERYNQLHVVYIRHLVTTILATNCSCFTQFLKDLCILDIVGMLD